MTNRNTEAIKKMFSRLPGATAHDLRDALGMQPNDQVPLDLLYAYFIAHKVIAGVVENSTHVVDAAAIVAVGGARKKLADLMIERPELSNGLEEVWGNITTIFNAMEYAPPARERGAGPGM